MGAYLGCCALHGSAVRDARHVWQQRIFATEPRASRWSASALAAIVHAIERGQRKLCTSRRAQGDVALRRLRCKAPKRILEYERTVLPVKEDALRLSLPG